jgi:hypothetical protein
MVQVLLHLSALAQFILMWKTVTTLTMTATALWTMVYQLEFSVELM